MRIAIIEMEIVRLNSHTQVVEGPVDILSGGMQNSNRYTIWEQPVRFSSRQGKTQARTISA